MTNLCHCRKMTHSVIVGLDPTIYPIGLNIVYDPSSPIGSFILKKAASTKVFSTVKIAKLAGLPPLGRLMLPGFIKVKSPRCSKVGT